MIDTTAYKGQLLSAFVMGLTIAHALNDDKKSQEIPGAVNYARLLMIGCSREQQKAFEEHFDESRSEEENAKAMHEAFPNHGMEVLLKSFSYEQLREIMRVANILEGSADTLGRTVQYAAARFYPAQFRKDMAERGEEGPTLTIIDLSGLRPPPGAHPFTPPRPDVHS